MKLTHVEEKKVVEAIQAAEGQTSGEIRVHIAKKIHGTIYQDACTVFESLGMTQTQEKNGILIFLVPSQKQFTIIGDLGIHQKVGNSFWDSIRDVMQDDFKKGDFIQGLIKGIEKCGQELAKHFPRCSNDKNELSDQVTTS